MSKQTFAERCQIAQQLLPYAQYRAMLTKLHAEMLAELAEQPDLQTEILEQCRINGMSAEREDALRARNERLEREASTSGHTIQQLVTALEGSGTTMRSEQWYGEIEAVAAGKHHLNSKGEGT